MSRVEVNRPQQTLAIPESGIRLRAPGLVGNVVWHGERTTTNLRAETAESPLLSQALLEAGLEDRHTLEINAPTPQRPMSYQRLLTSDVAPDEVEIDVPTRANELQFVLYTDEDGVTSLQFPKAKPAQAPAPSIRGETHTVTYRVPLRHATGQAGQPSQSRFLGGAARKVLKVVARKLLQPVAGKAVFAAVELWEDKWRAEQGFHAGTFEQFLATPVVGYDEWNSLSGRKALLFLHGTTSTTSGAFQGLKGFSDVANELYRRYQGRVLGFNHHTLTKSVAQNLCDFYTALKPGDYTFDVISHSRGGLVARSLLELNESRVSELIKKQWNVPNGVKVHVNKIIFVGTPNDATDLADPKDIPGVLNRLAAIVGLLKDAPPVLSLGAVLSIASGVAQAILEGISDLGAAGLKALPGLADMAPECTFLADLANAQPDRYFAIQAQYRAQGGLRAAVENGGTDLFFHKKPNDLIVPTDGVSQAPAFRLSTAAPSHVFAYAADQGVNHINYFYQRPTWTNILNFLN